VIVNPENAKPLSIALPGGDWQTACDENGATTGGTLSGAIAVPAKAGLVLFKQ